MSDEPIPVLDAGQLVRIENVHRGFLYQHLYAVGCLLRAQRAGVTTVLVERDEDVEVVSADRRIYVQVKSRSGPLTWSDIESAMLRFATLRDEHACGSRAGAATFVLAANVEPGPRLQSRMKQQDWPPDVAVHWPTVKVANDAALPLPQADVAAALFDCTTHAGTLPYAQLSPETLIWKLAGAVMAASAGNPPRFDHAFKTAELPQLFEQLVIQLQDFPAPPARYRAHAEEPALQDDTRRVRIITGYSGAGKTAWVSQAAVHAQGLVVYFDVTDTPGPTVASSVARELAARLFGNQRGGFGKVLLPGATGSEILQLIGTHLAAKGEEAMIVIDNAHRIPPSDLARLVQHGTAFRFVLLCQPERSVAELQMLLGIASESLRGWTTDTVASEVSARGCRGDYAACERLLGLTAGMPLYVQNAIGIAHAEYAGDIGALCNDLEAKTHVVETAQELILRRVFEGYSDQERHAIGVLSLSEVPLDQAGTLAVLKAVLKANDQLVARLLRKLRTMGCLEVFGGNRTKIHDAMRLLGQGHLSESGGDVLHDAHIALRDVIKASLSRDWDIAKFRLYLRLLAATGDVKTLAQLATDELFHEMGHLSEIRSFLEAASTSGTTEPGDRFWALDGLLLAELKAGQFEIATKRLDLMDKLISDHSLGDRERLVVAMKRLNLLGVTGGAIDILAAIQNISASVPTTPAHQRIFRYNSALALFGAGQATAAICLTSPLIREYYELLGIRIQDVLLKSEASIRPLLKKSHNQSDHLKHLADTLELQAKAMNASGRGSEAPFLVHAMKFYNLANAYEALVRVGQDLVDDFVGRHDFIGAREIIESHLLPSVTKLKLLDRMIPVRSQYAVVLAYCREFDAADAEMERLAPYEAGLSEQGQAELRNQRRAVAELRRSGPPPQWIPPAQGNFIRHVPQAGRNQPCPCGSGRKYKKCHG